MSDGRRKGKQNGEKHASNKLTEKDVLEIRQLFDVGDFDQPQLAKKFNVTQSNVSCIIRRKSWKHI